MTKISFLGIGLMGLPMCKNLLRAGQELRVWNRTPDKAAPLARLGAVVCDSVVDCVRGSEVVITMLADGEVVLEQLRQLCEAQVLSAPMIVIDMSSTSARQAQQIAALLAAQGVAYVDAPVSGGVRGAELASLAIMAGGDPADYARVEPLLRLLGRPTRVGPSGSGQIAKLANQAMVAAYIGIVSEAVLMLERAGVDVHAFQEALKGGFADSTVLQLHGQRMAEREFSPGGKVATQLKDLNNVMEAAQLLEIELPMTEELQRRYQKLAADPGRVNLDHSALFLELLDRNNVGS